ncbi:6-carboxytetrahydropterin synthase [Piscirickettsia salmonis]|uniref:6-carboxytetrahydropterin synthase n=1 Tax=Piscirickettsia salmonis TaxID=1238 RepID=UPI0007C91961|nr:6-pyruvoyl tetrahydropterin synthase [Piscirickettsiaceae bacterium NZ-RLO1]
MAGLFVDDLTVIDFSYLHDERGILGESWIVDIELYGDLNPENMVFDFSHVKKQLKHVIDSTVDHKFVIARYQPDLVIDSLNHQCQVRYQGAQTFEYNAPEQAVTILESEEVTFASVKAYLLPILEAAVPENVYKVKVNLRAEVIKDEFYHYTHGLKHHFGDCQRMVHGHRSTIEIYENGQRNLLEEKKWAARWCDIYLGSQEDLCEKISIENSAMLSLNGKNDDFYRFSYRSEQGLFELKILKANCEILNSDTTVECIAEFIAQKLKAQRPLSEFKVKAFEGVAKGAIAFA